MDRVFMNSWYVQCSKCFRIFCCVNHRMEHERRSHGTPAAMPVLIKRRFRSHAPAHPLANIGNVVKTVNCRKRVFAKVVEQSAVVSDVRSAVGESHTKRRQQSNETMAREVLKACRPSQLISLKNHLRPVAESCPSVSQPPLLEIASDAASLPPSREIASVAASIDTAFDVEPDTPVPLTPLLSPKTPTVTGRETFPSQSLQHADSPPSFYQTPMQTMSGTFMLPDSVTSINTTPSVNSSAVTSTTPSAVDAATPSATTTTDVQVCSDVKPLPADLSMVHCRRKGFFWSNMARRIRLALRPAKPRTVEENTGNNSSPIINMSKYYGNIHSRRPISSVMLSPLSVNARPSLDDIRKAHEEANTLTSDTSG